jgi:hypothetical protein
MTNHEVTEITDRTAGYVREIVLERFWGSGSPLRNARRGAAERGEQWRGPKYVQQSKGSAVWYEIESVNAYARKHGLREYPGDSLHVVASIPKVDTKPRFHESGRIHEQALNEYWGLPYGTVAQQRRRRHQPVAEFIQKGKGSTVWYSIASANEYARKNGLAEVPEAWSIDKAPISIVKPLVSGKSVLDSAVAALIQAVRVEVEAEVLAQHQAILREAEALGELAASLTQRLAV